MRTVVRAIGLWLQLVEPTTTARLTRLCSLTGMNVVILGSITRWLARPRSAHCGMKETIDGRGGRIQNS